jgi:hypothetical protein
MLAASTGALLVAFSYPSAAQTDAGGSGCSDAGVSAAGAWFWDSNFLIPPNSAPNAVWAFAPDDAWIGGENILVHWDGTSWTSVANPTVNRIDGIWGSSSTDVWAVAGGIGGAGSYTLIHWDGSSWSVVDPGIPDNLNAIWGDAQNDVWVAGLNHVLHFDGTTWTAQSSASGTGIWGGGPNDVWAVQQSDPMFHFAGSWTAVPSGAATAQDAVFETVWMPRPGEAWAAGWAVYHFEGLAWVRVPVPLGAFWKRAWGRATDDLWIAGDAGIIHWDGTSWTAQSTDSFNAVGGYARQAGRQHGPFACTDREGVWAVREHALFRFVPEALASPAMCGQIGGTCAPSCGANQFQSDYSCSGSGGVCCVSSSACLGPISCCNPDRTFSNATQTCDDGQMMCPPGTSPYNCPF